MDDKKSRASSVLSSQFSIHRRCFFSSFKVFVLEFVKHIKFQIMPQGKFKNKSQISFAKKKKQQPNKSRKGNYKPFIL